MIDEGDYDQAETKLTTLQNQSNTRFAFSLITLPLFQEEEIQLTGTEYFSDGNCTIMVYAVKMNVIEDNETIDTYYQRDLVAIGPAATFKTKTVKGNSYVVSYVEGDMVFYHKEIAQDGVVTTLIIEYLERVSSQYEPVVNEVSNSLTGGSQG